MKKSKIAIVLGGMCFTLTVAIIVQYNTVKSANQITGTSKNSDLKTEVLKWKQKYEEIYEQLEKAEENLEYQRKVSTKNDSESTQIQEDLKKMNSLIGSIDVKGNGVIITLEDNQNISTQNVGVLDNISNYLIHDSDLLTLVNELKNAGAEAISINDERIISNTAITCDGNVILINGNKVGSPFTIKAIGSQELILGAIQRPGGFLEEELKKFGLVNSVVRQNNITIYKYNGVID